mgnify:CR=1 FL=1
MAKRPEPVQIVKQRRDAALQRLVDRVPYIQFLGIQFERHGDELTAVMPFSEQNIGNPMIPALHGGATAAFLEVAAIIELTWAMTWEEMETARVNRLGRRYASVHVEGWQDNRSRLFSQATGHFLMPARDG